jgi:hypothetical protein
MQPRKPLPASVSTVLLYLSHLSQEGEVREGSLNPYLAAVNQMHQDAGFRRPALGHYVDLLRKGFANVEAQATSSAPVRMPLPPAVVHDILMLGLASSDDETLFFSSNRVRSIAINAHANCGPGGAWLGHSLRVGAAFLPTPPRGCFLAG